MEGLEADKTKTSMFFVLLSILSISSCSSAFNITNLLNKQSDFSTFNKYLSVTKLADDINKRSTITVLALNNDAMGGISSDNSFPLKSVMSVHIILDYFDKDKLTKLAKNNSSTKLTTLFQSSGEAKDQQGFVRVEVVDGEICFGSASKGGEMNSKLVRSVTAQPYNISVLEVGSIIRVPNINASPAPEKAPAPKKGKKSSTAESPADDEEGEAPSPSKVTDSTPPKPAYADDVITADSPSTAWGYSSDARATASEMGFRVVSIGLTSVLVACFF